MVKPIKVRVPGKLLLAGEYAILVPGSLALGLAVNRYLDVELERASHFRIETALLPSAWECASAAELDPETCPGVLRFVISALNLGLSYLCEQDPQLEHNPPAFHLKLASQLDAAAMGKKIGLGSSGAATVAVLAALLAWAGADLSAPALRLKLFKLAYLAHSQIQGNGSGADIATSILGAVTAYTAPEIPPRAASLLALLEQRWPALALERLPWPEACPVAFGWTGQPAASRDWIQYFQDWRAFEPEAAAQFLFDSNANTLGLAEALRQGDVDLLQQGLGRARRILAMLNEDFPEAPETPQLQALVAAAEALGGVGKFSGAGGGDCGLALVEAHRLSELWQAWRKQGIEPLDLKLDRLGVRLL